MTASVDFREDLDFWFELYRCLNAAHIATYVGLRGNVRQAPTYTLQNFMFPLCQLYGCKECGLLTKTEKDMCLKLGLHLMFFFSHNGEKFTRVPLLMGPG